LSTPGIVDSQGVHLAAPQLPFAKSEHKSYKKKKNPAMYYDIIGGIEF